MLQSSSDSGDDIPLSAIRGIRDLVSFKRRQAAANRKTNFAATVESYHVAAMPSEISSSNTSSPRKASQHAAKNMAVIMFDEREILDDSDADPVFVPEKKERKRNESNSELVYISLADNNGAHVSGEQPTTPKNK